MWTGLNFHSTLIIFYKPQKEVSPREDFSLWPHSYALCKGNLHTCSKHSKQVAEAAKPSKTQSQSCQGFHEPGTFAEWVTRWGLVFGTFLRVSVGQQYISPWGSYLAHSGTKGPEFGGVLVGTAALEAQRNWIRWVMLRKRRKLLDSPVLWKNNYRSVLNNLTMGIPCFGASLMCHIHTQYDLYIKIQNNDWLWECS